ncbi:hypothetical protein K461DRAFT_140562 [Myriangium duriaei CBS 260.36]|uniref:Uncharacterized protein n=1 Tax=Myriangium duriaei CBS 260.36 TaxID=1168546 RepID=A0A9P4J586_9PEZI|nr:hypothetical protein K461DRAFT_140562 [Myriangium duriaei CBS 260.36]
MCVCVRARCHGGVIRIERFMTGQWIPAMTSQTLRPMDIRIGETDEEQWRLAAYESKVYGLTEGLHSHVTETCLSLSGVALLFPSITLNKLPESSYIMGIGHTYCSLSKISSVSEIVIWHMIQSGLSAGVNCHMWHPQSVESKVRSGASASSASSLVKAHLSTRSLAETRRVPDFWDGDKYKYEPT